MYNNNSLVIRGGGGCFSLLVMYMHVLILHVRNLGHVRKT